MVNTEGFEGLEELGLTEYQQAAYISLLRYGDMTGSEVSDKTEIPKTRVYDVLRSLEDEGLVYQIQKSPMKFSPVEPEDGLGSLFRKKVNRLEFLEEKTLEELEDIGPDEEQESASEKVDVIHGQGSMFDQISQRLQDCSEELKILGVGRKPPKSTEIEVRKLMERGVDVKFILTDSGEAGWMKEQSRELGFETRVYPREPNFAVMVIDQKEAMISVLNPEEDEDRISIFFRNKALAKSLSDYYSGIWAEADSL